MLDRVRHACRTRHLSIRIEKAYIGWVRRCVRIHNLAHPADLNEKQVRHFLAHLAAERNVADLAPSASITAEQRTYTH